MNFQATQNRNPFGDTGRWVSAAPARELLRVRPMVDASTHRLINRELASRVSEFRALESGAAPCQADPLGRTCTRPDGHSGRHRGSDGRLF